MILLGDIIILPAIDEPSGLGRMSLGEVYIVVEPSSSLLAAMRKGASFPRTPWLTLEKSFLFDFRD
jgi:hypothetical protein